MTAHEIPTPYHWYSHYKTGKLYQVLGFADLEATGKRMVIYRKDYQCWVRPLCEWNSRFKPMPAFGVK